MAEKDSEKINGTDNQTEHNNVPETGNKEITEQKEQKEGCPCRALGSVGGQAIIEGVMMRHAEDYAVALRMPNGKIRVTTDKFVSVRKKHKILNLPIIRGCVNMVETLKLSMGVLTESADALGLDEEEEETKFEIWLREHFGKSLVDVAVAIGSVLGVVLAFGLFFLLPSLAVKGVDSLSGGHLGWFRNLIEGLIKIGIFIAYIAAVSLMPDIRRTFEYHGAEHKSIFCYEAGEELTAENAKKFKRFHPRCGTSFIFVILALSILINSLPFVTWDNVFLRLITKLALLPVIVGIGYEFLMYAGKHDNAVTRILSAPGLWMQRLTTREPDESQLEVAIASLICSLPEEFPEQSQTLIAAYTKSEKNEAEKAEDENAGEDAGGNETKND